MKIRENLSTPPAWRHKLPLCSLLTFYIFAVRRKGELGPATFGYLT